MIIDKIFNNFWFFLAFIGVIVLLINDITPIRDMIPESTTTIPKTTTITLTTLFTTTIPGITTTPTTTVENATTTVQVRKPISVIAHSCNRDTDVVTLTISNKGDAKIEEDEIDILINDEYAVTFGKAIEPGQLEKNSFQGRQGSNKFEIFSPSNSVRLFVTCY
jgi:archaellum component FlaF (FlaF/FlaG flagellin family)